MPRPNTTPSCEPTPLLSASTRRTISEALGEGLLGLRRVARGRWDVARPPARVPVRFNRLQPCGRHRRAGELHKLHIGDVLRGHPGRKAGPVKRLRWLLCPGAPGNDGVSPGPSGVGTAAPLLARSRHAAGAPAAWEHPVR